ncbi:hypothetical protein FMEAI12_1810045 [Parafrankia sp. Ea1.12]|nr:hypothetical protein FMEAI12_1810045 [Parafrankia sp. Ea1.12]
MITVLVSRAHARSLTWRPRRGGWFVPTDHTGERSLPLGVLSAIKPNMREGYPRPARPSSSS